METKLIIRNSDSKDSIGGIEPTFSFDDPNSPEEVTPADMFLLAILKIISSKPELLVEAIEECRADIEGEIVSNTSPNRSIH